MGVVTNEQGNMSLRFDYRSGSIGLYLRESVQDNGRSAMALTNITCSLDCR